MLGLARHAQQAGWGAAGLNLKLNIRSESDFGYAVYQEPSFSWNTDIDDDITWNTTIGFDEPGVYSVSDIPDLTNYKKLRYTGIITFKPDFPTELAGSEGFNISHKFLGGDGSFLGNWEWVRENNFEDATAKRLVINAMGVTSVPLPGSDYEDYNGRWLTTVISMSDSENDFSDWQPAFPPFNPPNYYVRACVYDTETGELLARQDVGIEFENRPQGWPSDLTEWIADGTDDADGITSESFGTEYAYAMDVIPNFDDLMTAGISAEIAGIWTSIGTGFDPLTATDRSWLTTRPNAVIEGAVAWQNAQFVDTSNRPDNSDPPNNFNVVYSTAEGDDRFSQQDDRQIALIPFNGDENFFDANFKTDPIKSRG